jgi:oligopeptidase B
MDPPRASRRPVSITQVGRTRTDDFRWMKDDAWQEVLRDPSLLRADIREHLEAENAHARALLGHTDALQDHLFAEMRGRIREDDSTPPLPDGAFAYYTRFREGGQHPILCRRPIIARTADLTLGDEQILLDGDEEARDRVFWSLGGAAHSPDHRLLAWAVDDAGSEYNTIRIKDLTTGAVLDDIIESAAGSLAWAADSRTLFWNFRDENGRPTRVLRRTVGTGGVDIEVYAEPDPGFFLSVGKTDDGGHIVLSTGGHTTSEVWLIPADRPDAPPLLVSQREEGHEYDLTRAGDRFFIRTNQDGAVDFQIMQAPVADPRRQNWRPCIPHRPGTLVEALIGFRGFLVRQEMRDALPVLTIRRLEDSEEHTIAQDEQAYALGASGGFEFDTTTLRFSYNSPSTPTTTFDYDMVTRTRVVRKVQEIPSGHDPSAYEVLRIEAPSHDGVKVPVTLLRHRSTPLDGTAPVLLYGYGSYGLSTPADFRSTRLSLVDRGFIHVIGHVRGGMERGYQWYLDGKLDSKANTFLDLVAVARDLVRRGWARERRIVIQGGSAGGLLVGASVNIAPELFGAVVAAVPFVDVLNTMSDSALPLTPPEWPEWGNPLESAPAHDAILAWSPYDNVREDAPYPPILATAGLTDPRVTYWEPAKWIARLRHLNPHAGPFVLKTNMEAGHGGASGRFDRLKELAYEFAFVLWAMDHPEARRPD